MLRIHKLRCYVQTMGIDPSRTFDSLLVTPSNRPVMRTIKRAIGNSETRPNVVLIRGPRGSGKTHLMHAIANAIASRSQRQVVRMIAAHTFSVDFVEQFRGGTLSSFRKTNTLYGSFLIVDGLEDLARTPVVETELHQQIAFLLASRGTAILALGSTTPDHERRIKRAMTPYGRRAVVRWRAPALPTRVAALQGRLRELGSQLTSGTLATIARRSSSIPEARAALDNTLLRLTV